MGLSLCGPTSKMRGTNCGNMLILKAEDKTFSTSIQAMLPLAEVCSLMYIFTPSRIFYAGFIVLFLIYLAGDRVR